MKKLYRKIVEFFSLCPKCRSFNLDNGYWIRGWNDLCEQACGDLGKRCFDCGHIQWEKSISEYKEVLPNWCRAFENK